MTDAQWYALLTEAQQHWFSVVATHAPEWLYGAPTLLTSSDGGYTYDFPSGVYPVGHIEVLESTRGALLRPGPYWDPGADYTPEGDKIRICCGRTRTFASGPYARYATMPGVIDASTEPTLEPKEARRLLPYRACALWASQGGLRDPAFYLALEQKAWGGDPNLPGDVGILGGLKTQFFAFGASATPGSGGAWWRNIG